MWLSESFLESSKFIFQIFERSVTDTPLEGIGYNVPRLGFIPYAEVKLSF